MRDFEIKMIASKFILNFTNLRLCLKDFLIKNVYNFIYLISKNIFVGRFSRKSERGVLEGG